MPNKQSVKNCHNPTATRAPTQCTRQPPPAQTHKQEAADLLDEPGVLALRFHHITSGVDRACFKKQQHRIFFMPSSSSAPFPSRKPRNAHEDEKERGRALFVVCTSAPASFHFL